MATSLSTTAFTPNASLSASSNSMPPFLVSLSTTSPPAPLWFSTSTPPAVSQNGTLCPGDQTALRVPLAVVYSLFFIFGLVGNLFALWVFIFVHKNRNSVRLFLINCAVADLVLLACLPFRVFYHLNGNKWVLGPVLCKMVGNLFYMNMYISITLLGLISLDRYLSLRAKGRARRGTKIRLWGHSKPWSWVACVVLWSVSLVAVVPMIATAEDKGDGSRCFHYKKRQNAKGKAYFNLLLVLMFWIVFIMLVVSYAKIASQLLKVSRDKPDLPNSQRFKRTAKKSFFVLFLFTLCFGPYHAFRPIYIFSQLKEEISCEYMQLADNTNEVMLLFSAFNSCLDPVMYFLLSGSVRKTALRALGSHFGSWFTTLQDASNSSTVDCRRPSMQISLSGNVLNTSSITPRNSIYVINSTLRRTGVTTDQPKVQQ